jgi:hypothetical protein
MMVMNVVRLCGAALLLASVSFGAAMSTAQEEPSPQQSESKPAEPSATPPADEPTPAGTNDNEKDGEVAADDTPAGTPANGTAENNPLASEMDERLDESVHLGLEYLKREQKSDGSFGVGRYSRHVAVTSLCALAFMADGNLPGRGEYGEQVAEGLRFVLDHCQESGLIAADDSHGPMYGHGFAALFLGEVYGASPQDDRVRDALVKAVDLIVGTQNEEGGWRYNPVPYDADISVTICQIMALRSARNAGIKVPKETIDRAVDYVRRCQNPDGGFKYMLQAGGSAWPRTAAGVASLFYAGIYEDDSIDRGLDYLILNVLPGPGRSIGQAHYFYGHYYAVQAMYLAGGEYWGKWWPAVREELLSRQTSNGGWLDHHAGSAYATGMACIVLQMPKRYLPIFQK